MRPLPALAAGTVASSSAAPGSAAPSSPPPGAADRANARRLRLVARHRLGVPLHDQPKDHGKLRRVPDGAEVTLVAEAGGNWLHVRLDDGSEGFVTTRYVAADAGSPPEAKDAPRVGSSGAPDRERTCELARRQATRPPPAGVARVATFNVRWFPDGQPGKKAPPSGGTDLGFLACSIAATGAEVVLVQEFKRGARPEASLRTVLQDLDQLTQGSWQARFDECPNESAQHVGILFDQARARALGAARTLAELNPLGGACTGSLRPGLGQRLRLSSGQSVDFVSVHLKSGTDARSYALRQQSLAALGKLTPAPGEQVVVGGDLNTMGCSECAAPISADEERRLAARAGKLAGFSLFDPAPGCSHYHRGKPVLLDGFWIGRAERSHIEVAGACAELECGPLTLARQKDAFEKVSDHCPLVLSLPAL